MGGSAVQDSVTWLWAFLDAHPDVDVRPFTLEDGFVAYVPMQGGQTRRVHHPNDLRQFMTELEQVTASRGPAHRAGDHG